MREDFKNLIVTQALKNESSLEVAFETFVNWQNILNSLAEDFYNKLREPLYNQLTTLPGEWLISYKNAFNIYIENSTWSLEFGIGDYDGDRVHFFINSNDENKMALYSFVKEIHSGTANPRIWYQRTKQPYNRWDTTFDGLLAVYQSDEFINYCIAMLSGMAKTIADYYKQKDE